ncbi:MAG: hypothetical protein GDA56_14185 [Hormoscilla sp. GM7CHS1pb]|nr:hypothetical protein [Hormoscilla sp. GM7CHS1pb]
MPPPVGIRRRRRGFCRSQPRDFNTFTRNSVAGACIYQQEAYPKAIKKAALEVDEGAYDAATLETMVNREDIIDRALQAIAAESESQ